MSEESVTLVDILEWYLYKEDLQRLLEDAGLKKSGNKRELAERLVFESDYDPVYLLSKLTKDELFLILDEEFGITLPKSTPKQALIETLLEQLDETEPIDETPSYVSKTKNKGYSKRNLQREKREYIFESIYEALKSFKPYRIEGESDLEKQVVAYLRGSISVEVTPQKAGARYGALSIPDIVVEDIAVEIKFFRRGSNRSEWDRAIGQIIRYYIEGDYRAVILFVLDNAGIVPEHSLEEYERLLPWLSIIVKR
ncbi:hypothetical protein JCM16138_18970 [Thermococcus atlanticus]